MIQKSLLWLVIYPVAFIVYFFVAIKPINGYCLDMKTSILLEFVLAEIRKSQLTQRQIAEACCIPYSTLTKIIQRTIEDPGVAHVERLAKFFGWQFELDEPQGCGFIPPVSCIAQPPIDEAAR